MNRPANVMLLAGIACLILSQPWSASAKDPERTKDKEFFTGPESLSRFFSALHALDSDPKNKVRIGLFGDSHSAADIYTGVLRQRLQGRYGNGGPGLLIPGVEYVGYGPRIKSGNDGKWRKGSVLYSGSGRPAEGDGIYGPSGLGLCSQEDGATSFLELPCDGPGGGARLIYSMEPGAVLLANLNGEVFTITDQEGGLSNIRSRWLSTPGTPWRRVDLLAQKGRSCVLGLEVAGEAGLVLDVMAVNGARLDTLLKALAFQGNAAFSGLTYDLLVFAYGTNEIVDSKLDPAVFVQKGGAAVGQARTLFPQADCLVLGPPLSFVKRSQTAQPRLQAVNAGLREIARTCGCAFLDLPALMTDGFNETDWLAKPQDVLNGLWDRHALLLDRDLVQDVQSGKSGLYSGDGIHLSRRGYELLGSLLLSAIVGSGG